MKRYLVLILFISMHQLVTRAQSEIVPLPSPTAYNMLQIIPEHNTSYYTGDINIDIPFLQIKAGSKTIPISLKYTGSNGIRVTDEASWVGLGWSLNTGGVVTCTIQSTPDEIDLKQGGKGA